MLSKIAVQRCMIPGEGTSDDNGVGFVLRALAAMSFGYRPRRVLTKMKGIKTSTINVTWTGRQKVYFGIRI